MVHKRCCVFGNIVHICGMARAMAISRYGPVMGLLPSMRTKFMEICTAECEAL